MDFILGPTREHVLKYCEIHELNPDNFEILELETPWHETQPKLARTLKEDSYVRVLDNDYRDKPLKFNDVMSYLEFYSDNFKLEIVENVHLN